MRVSARKEATMTRITIFVVSAVAALSFGAVSLSAQPTYTAPIYKSAAHSCDKGATDTSGPTYGTFSAHQQHSTIFGTVQLSGVPGNAYFTIWLHESGSQCLYFEVAALTTDSHGSGLVHFSALAHSHESVAWVSAVHSQFITYRSTTVPINR